MRWFTHPPLAKLLRVAVAVAIVRRRRTHHEGLVQCLISRIRRGIVGLARFCTILWVGRLELELGVGVNRLRREHLLEGRVIITEGPLRLSWRKLHIIHIGIFGGRCVSCASDRRRYVPAMKEIIDLMNSTLQPAQRCADGYFWMQVFCFDLKFGGGSSVENKVLGCMYILGASKRKGLWNLTCKLDAMTVDFANLVFFVLLWVFWRDLAAGVIFIVLVLHFFVTAAQF